MMARWKRPLYGVGAVPPSEAQRRCVFFVCANRDGVLTPVGTCFLVSLPIEGGVARYFVTAGHIVRGEAPRWIRFRRADGGTHDELAEEWVTLPPGSDGVPEVDIAATPCEFDPGDEYIMFWQEEEYFSDKWPPGVTVDLGARAYFMGLLADVPHMADRAIPMMRAAAVGALNTEDVPVRDRYGDGTEYTRREPCAHLIDTYSRSGFSGAPVYVEHQLVVLANPAAGQLFVEQSGFTALFGVLVGHFGSPGDNAGVAVVVPIEAVRQLLNQPKLVEWREGKAVEMKENQEERLDESAAQLDSLPESESEFERFERLTGKLVRVPKKELDEKRREDG